MKVAERHRVSPRTVHRDASFAKAVDNIGEKVGPSNRDKILSGDLKLTKQEVKSVAAMEPEKAKAVVQEIESGRATREMIADVQNSDLTVKDSTGNVVPEMLRQTFQHATEFQDMIVGIDAMLRRLEAISQTSMAAYSTFRTCPCI